MKWSQFFLLMAAVYMAPRVDLWVAVGLGGVFTVAGLAALVRGE